MSSDFEDRLSAESMSDEELQRLVREELATQESVDADNILVRVRDGIVTLSGRVGTEQERRVAEHVVTDVIGASGVENLLVVDAIRRDEEPEAIDDHLANISDEDEEPLGRPADDLDDSTYRPTEELDARLYGTHSVQRAIAEGTPWEPPDSPTPEGLGGEEPDVDSAREDH
jgi:hypothetical protein